VDQLSRGIRNALSTPSPVIASGAKLAQSSLCACYHYPHMDILAIMLRAL
jgi:hypothetical protein